MSGEIRTRVRRLGSFDVADVLTDAREAIYSELETERTDEALRMLERWEAMLGPELCDWWETGRELGAAASLPPEARSFVEHQQFRKPALERLTRAVARGRVARIRRWRFAAAAYRRAVAEFLARWQEIRTIGRAESRLRDRVRDAIEDLRHPAVGRELEARWTRDDPPLGARRRRLARTQELLDQVEAREQRRSRAAAEGRRLRERVARWLGDSWMEDLPSSERTEHEVSLLRRLLNERDTRGARRLARRVGRDHRVSLRSALGLEEGKGSPLFDLVQD